jgi:multiple sugar transport system permease protein
MLSNENLYPVTLGLFTWFSEKNQTTYNVVLTGSLISVIPLIAAFILLSRYWRNGISAGAVKG